VVTFLEREELDFLDGIGKDILFSQGVKVPRSTILKHIVDLCQKLNEQGAASHEELIANIVGRVEEGGKDV